MNPAAQLRHEHDYRSDIDGLRAVAVICVLLYHAFPHWLPGGFIGVDLFFVISGFLITGLLLARFRQRRFSLLDFYQRRILRIFPVLIIVLVMCLLYGWFTLLASEYAQLGSLAAGGAAFIANEILRQQTGYFDLTAASKPLLHLWSLGIEEQYYILWPGLLALLWGKKHRHVLAGLLLLGLGSFVLNIAWVYHSPENAFYSLPSRFWELLAGSVLAWLHQPDNPWQSFHAKLGKHGALWQGWLACACLVVPLVLINPDSLFPGWWALLPVLSAWLFIDAGPHAPFNRILLSNPLMVNIGLISYPLYLWHWPLLVFARQAGNGYISPAARLIALIASVILAWCSYRFIEQPIRRSSYRRQITLLLIAMMVSTGLGAWWIYLSDGFPERHMALRYDAVDDAMGDWDYPGIGFDGRHLRSNVLRGHSHDEVLFLGDSHMEQYWPRLKSLYEDAPGYFTLRFATFDGCASLPGLNRPNSPEFPAGGCALLYQAARTYANSAHVKRIVIDNYWERYQNWPGFSTAMQALSKDILGWQARGIHVYIIMTNPKGRFFVPQNQVRRLPFLAPTITQMPRRWVEKNLTASSQVKNLAQSTHATLINPLNYLCTQQSCPTVNEDGDPINKDSDHLRPESAEDQATFIDQTVLP
ncbi:MAG: acyltransferase [Pseudomonadales bacterium]|nr:acyltransferase [Pseudomonadales bacterium]